MLGMRRSRVQEIQQPQMHALTSVQLPVMTTSGFCEVPEIPQETKCMTYVLSALDDEGRLMNQHTEHAPTSTSTATFEKFREAFTKVYRNSDALNQRSIDVDYSAADDTEPESTSSQQSSRGRKRHAATLNSTASKGTSSFNDGEPGTGHGDVGQSNTRFNHQQRATPQEKPARPIRKQTLLISDPAAVKRFFESRINDMQQLAAKKIAKAWIKERTHLLIHILRLRPTVEQLKLWSGGSATTSASAASGIKEDWAPFLETLAPMSIFDVMPDVDGKNQKRDHRRTLLRSMYDIAFKEEMHVTTGMYANDFYSYEEEERKAKVTVKRPMVDISEDADIESTVTSRGNDWADRSWRHPSKRTRHRTSGVGAEMCSFNHVGGDTRTSSAYSSDMAVHPASTDHQQNLTRSRVTDGRTLQGHRPYHHIPAHAYGWRPSVTPWDDQHGQTLTSSAPRQRQQQQQPLTWPMSSPTPDTSCNSSFDSGCSQSNVWDPYPTDLGPSARAEQQRYNFGRPLLDYGQQPQTNTVNTSLQHFHPIDTPMVSPLESGSMPFGQQSALTAPGMHDFAIDSNPEYPTGLVGMYEDPAMIRKSEQFLSLHECDMSQNTFPPEYITGLPGGPPSPPLQQPQDYHNYHLEYLEQR